MFALTADHLAVRDMAKSFADERLAPGALRWDETEHFPADVRDLFLNHKGRSVTDRHYNRYSPHNEHRAILEKWARFLTGKTNVIGFPGAERAA